MQLKRQERLTVMKSGTLAGAMVVAMTLVGCYKELPPQERVQAPPAPAAQPPAEKPAQSNAGVTPPPSGALGAAKRSAQNTVEQAEKSSQQAVDNADKDE